MEEIWKDVPGYEGLYLVSNLGRVMSPEKRVSMPKNGPTATGLRKQKLRKLGTPSNIARGREYYYCNLSKNGVAKKYNVHILMWRAFIDKTYIPGVLRIDHIDGNRRNNVLTNLQLLSSRSNISKGFQQKGRMLPTGVTKSYKGKYVARIREGRVLYHLGTFLSPEEASAEYQRALANIADYKVGGWRYNRKIEAIENEYARFLSRL